MCGHIYGLKRKESSLGESTFKLTDENKSAFLQDIDEPVHDVLDDVRAHFSSVLENVKNIKHGLDDFSDVIEVLISEMNNCSSSYDEAVSG